MCGKTLKAGGVACVHNIKNPILLARHVMDKVKMNISPRRVYRTELVLTVALQPCNYQVSKTLVHKIKFGDIAVM